MRRWLRYGINVPARVVQIRQVLQAMVSPTDD